MKIVSNTSPLIALHHLGELEIIPKILHTGIFIPPAVAEELRSRGFLLEWTEVIPLQNPLAPRILNASLGPGESEAIALALEVGADVVLLDDKAARRLAVTMGLQVLGTLGLLLKAKEADVISEVRTRLDALRTLPFPTAPKLFDAVLKEAGE